MPDDDPLPTVTNGAAVIHRLVDELNEKLEEAVRAGLHVDVHIEQRSIEMGGEGGHDHRLVRCPSFTARISKVTVFRPTSYDWEPVLPK